MKKLILSISLLFISFAMYSQVPNGSFETWNAGLGSYQDPSGWTTSNSVYYFIDALGQAFGSDISHPTTVTKTTPGSLGTYAVKLQNVEGTESGSVSDTVPAFAALGTNFTQRPIALTGVYKFNQGAPGNSAVLDTALIIVGVTKWNATNKEPDTIGTGMLTIYNTKTAFTSFTINLNYKNGTTPDSLIIGLFSSTTEKNFPATNLIVDALSLTGITGINTPVSSIDPVQAYPNPASSELNLKDLPKGTTKVEVKDLTGRMLKVINVNSDFVNFNTTDLTSGMYYYSLTNEEGSVLYTGKFDVKN